MQATKTYTLQLLSAQQLCTLAYGMFASVNTSHTALSLRACQTGSDSLHNI